MTDDFTVKDSGARQEWPSGFRRDTQEGKPDYTLLPLEFLERWAAHMTKGAVKYGRDNWRKADDQSALERFQASAFRHLVQWLQGDRAEDHASAVAFNVAAAEYVRDRLECAEDPWGWATDWGLDEEAAPQVDASELGDAGPGAPCCPGRTGCTICRPDLFAPESDFQAQEAAPYRADVGPICLDLSPDGRYVCNAAEGHEGLHAAYAFGDGPYDTWPQKPERPACSRPLTCDRDGCSMPLFHDEPHATPKPDVIWKFGSDLTDRRFADWLRRAVRTRDVYPYT